MAPSYSFQLVLSLVLGLLAKSSSFFVSPSRSLTRTHRLPTSRPRRASNSVHLLRAQAMDGENLRPDIAQAMETMAEEAKEAIDTMVKENKVMLFMKGNKLFPQCGFSNTAVQVLRACEVDFETFDVLSDQGIRQGIKDYSNWPTIPQLYIDGEFTGGSDIMIESFQSGELKKTLEAKGCSFTSS